MDITKQYLCDTPNEDAREHDSTCLGDGDNAGPD